MVVTEVWFEAHTLGGTSALCLDDKPEWSWKPLTWRPNGTEKRPPTESSISCGYMMVINFRMCLTKEANWFCMVPASLLLLFQIRVAFGAAVTFVTETLALLILFFFVKQTLAGYHRKAFFAGIQMRSTASTSSSIEVHHESFYLRLSWLAHDEYVVYLFVQVCHEILG